MSGGSFNYLYAADLEDFINREGDLERMRDELIALGNAEDAVRETDEIILMLRQFRVLIETRANRMSPIWKAMEWWRSGDSGEEAVTIAIEKYRNPKLPNKDN
jgi:hypothetical protein